MKRCAANVKSRFRVSWIGYDVGLAHGPAVNGIVFNCTCGELNSKEQLNKGISFAEMQEIQVIFTIETLNVKTRGVDFWNPKPEYLTRHRFKQLSGR